LTTKLISMKNFSLRHRLEFKTYSYLERTIDW
jgi:hypothetical protein